ncbi:helicase HerA domain-containing protein [Gordonia sp. (in: high G+C Gram-positive bacteria)]|uniref:helicase HerA domain-containing protein n=1 Tax=Gordonia sp. (in: high G+C Gram-positive bacteria) TaxID=84139 RepID=UPI003F989147
MLASKLNRHTFWCGQSGSGKTYALGVLLEQVLLHTSLPIVVLDPNSDYVKLGSVREDAASDGNALTGRDIRILRPGADHDALKVRFVDINIRSRAAILQLDPILDREEFNVMLRTDTVQIDEKADATVVDLGSFSTPERQQATALASLDPATVQSASQRGRSVRQPGPDEDEFDTRLSGSRRRLRLCATADNAAFPGFHPRAGPVRRRLHAESAVGPGLGTSDPTRVGPIWRSRCGSDTPECRDTRTGCNAP